MRFKIISVGWNCSQFMERTLESIEKQTLKNWDVGIAYDPSPEDGGKEIIEKWCAQDPEHRKFRLNEDHLYAAHNQYDMIRALEPEEDDIIVFLDLDGDKFSHNKVLERLRDAYAEGNLVTYGQYRPIPDQGTSTFAKRYPLEVDENGTYRAHTRAYGCCFNHLRTMSARIALAIPENNFKYGNGIWYEGGTDYVFMLAGLELSGGKYKCFDEVLLDYNHANPFADNLTHPADSDRTVLDFLSSTPLQPLSPKEVPVPEVEEVVAETPVVRYLDAEERRVILAQYGRDWSMSILIETGTNNGDTPLTLKDNFWRVYTIELYRPLFDESRRRLAPYENITCLLGDSTKVLPELLGKIQESALIWLDGHCSGPGTGRGDLDTPVVQELEALFEDVDRGIHHVILVDDARIFDGQPEHEDEPHYADYPTLEWIEDLANAHNYDYEMKDDIVRLTPRV